MTTEEEPAVTEHDREDIGAHRLERVVIHTNITIGSKKFKTSTYIIVTCHQTINKILDRFDKQKTAHKIDKAKERKFQV